MMDNTVEELLEINERLRNYIHNILVAVHSEVEMPKSEMIEWLKNEIGMEDEDIAQYIDEINFYY